MIDPYSPVRIENIELAKKELYCKCGKKIYKEEPCGITATGKILCMHCTKEILNNIKHNTSILLKKLNNLYKQNLKKIIINRI